MGRWKQGGAHGCYLCCERCNTDSHRCPACGEPLPHGQDVCDKCAAELEAEYLDREHGRE